MRNKLVLRFDELGKEHTSIAGGKGANLGELYSKFEVPYGLVVSSRSFREFIDHNQLWKNVYGLQENYSHEKANVICDKIVSAHMPEHIEQEIARHLPAIKNYFVAVRSSAISEDSGEASWAGQLETYTNVPKKEVVHHIKKCWASLFSQRAMDYHSNQKQKKNMEMAVIIQEMLNPKISGICFTANPTTGNRNEIVIEAGFGLGELIVSGEITPDMYVVSKDKMQIEKAEVNTQNKMLIFADGKTTEVQLQEEKANSQKLPSQKIIELAVKAKEIESHYGSPQDIEWSIQNDRIYFLQTRPITTLQE